VDVVVTLSFGALATFGRAQPKSRCSQPPHELATLDVDGAGGDQLGSVLLGDVVVVSLEPAAGDAGAVSEVVQLVVGRVADQMAPLLASPPPASLVDQDGHGVTLSRIGGGWHTGSMTDPGPELDVFWMQHVADDRRLLDGLLARHREKHRRYHTAVHVAWVLRHVVELAAHEPVEHLDEIVAAAFYHDAVYEPSYPANERASARLARRDLATVGWDADAIERVGSMIEATEHGAVGAEGATGDSAVLLDADLAILGAEPAAYAAYVTGVRSEYRHVADDDWRTGRAGVLESFLRQPMIYRTTTGRDRWEVRARANVTAELADLTA
jgi:predicted metal-dependent HD superfamily phosphohydrolase